jgi:hypothetical protein
MVLLSIVCLGLFPFKYRSVYLSICLSVHLSICPSVYLSICLSVYLSICLSVYLSICLSVYLSICLSVYLSIMCICLSVYLSICLLSLSVFVCLAACLSVQWRSRVARSGRAAAAGSFSLVISAISSEAILDEFWKK